MNNGNDSSGTHWCAAILSKDGLDPTALFPRTRERCTECNATFAYPAEQMSENSGAQHFFVSEQSLHERIIISSANLALNKVPT